MSRLWDKGGELDRRVLAYTAGEDHRLDERLVRYDVKASLAHTAMLERQGLLEPEAAGRIRDGLQSLGDAHARGDWQIGMDDEDGHTALERRLTEAIGEDGGRVHLGRSRNDQVLTALRLYLRDAIVEIDAAVGGLVTELERLAERDGDIELPGYTHLQQAMPSSVGLWALGFASEFDDDRAGLRAAGRRADKNPLGSAAGYGTPGLDIDRDATTAALGFAEPHEPVTAVQLSRGKAEAAVLAELTLLTNDIARLASDLLLYYTREFRFVSLPERLTTGSSIMPQKRNPDVLELVRAAPATVSACLNECLMITTKLTSGYHRDLQRLKPPLFRGIDLTLDTVTIMAEMIIGLRFNADEISLDPGVHAAAEANRLVVEEGLSFREAYRRVGKQYTDG
ncbi:MAG: argininosuccinate lyase [Pseudomonadota bacterium]